VISILGIPICVMLALVIDLLIIEGGTNSTIFAVAYFIGIVIRVAAAAWYVNDKDRHAAWVFFSLFGLLGWIVLWCLDDRSAIAGRDAAA
jgi:hypothetical protein